jgi:hypothetical protein
MASLGDALNAAPTISRWNKRYRGIAAVAMIAAVIVSADGLEPSVGQETGSIDNSFRNRARSMVFLPDGRVLVTVDHDGTVRLWDTSTGRELSKQRSHGVSINERTVRLWDIRTGREVSDLQPPGVPPPSN